MALADFGIEIWSDIDNKFHLDETGAIKKVTNIDTVLQSLENIFLTTKGERVMRPQFGSALAASLFDPINSANARRIAHEVLIASKQEDRARISSINVVAVPDEGYYEVYMEVVIKELDLTTNFVRILRHSI